MCRQSMARADTPRCPVTCSLGAHSSGHRCGHGPAAAGLDGLPRQLFSFCGARSERRSLKGQFLLTESRHCAESVKAAEDCLAQFKVTSPRKQDPRREGFAASRADCPRLSRIEFPERSAHSLVLIRKVTCVAAIRAQCCCCKLLQPGLAVGRTAGIFAVQEGHLFSPDRKSIWGFQRPMLLFRCALMLSCIYLAYQRRPLASAITERCEGLASLCADVVLTSAMHCFSLTLEDSPHS